MNEKTSLFNTHLYHWNYQFLLTSTYSLHTCLLKTCCLFQKFYPFKQLNYKFWQNHILSYEILTTFWHLSNYSRYFVVPKKHSSLSKCNQILIYIVILYKLKLLYYTKDKGAERERERERERRVLMREGGCWERVIILNLKCKAKVTSNMPSQSYVFSITFCLWYIDIMKVHLLFTKQKVRYHWQMI